MRVETIAVSDPPRSGYSNRRGAISAEAIKKATSGSLFLIRESSIIPIYIILPYYLLIDE
jgi:hypothetical protein